MASEPVRRGTRARRLLGGGLLLAGWAAAVPAQPAAPPPGGIYTCIDAQGRRLTSDRPIPECLAREQRKLNRDGSVREVLPPTLTPEERAEQEAAERRRQLERNALADAVRRDRNLMARYPDQPAHDRTRQSALEPVRQAIKLTEKRLAALAAERKRLDNEAEFYKSRQMPASLRQALDGNDAAVAAQHAATKTQEAELARINALYDAELDRLKRLWSGTPPGTLPPTPPAAPVASSPRPVPRPTPRPASGPR